MNPRLFQVLIPIIAGFFLIKALWKYYKSHLNIYETFLSLSFWGCILAVALFPDTISKPLAKFLGIKNNVNAILFAGLGLMALVQFRIYILLRKQRADITELARILALKDSDKTKE